MNKLYYVLSPEMWEIVPILDDGTGPREYFRCFAYINAMCPIEAKVRAVKTKGFKKWREQQKDNNESPYIGLIARHVLRKDK